MMRIIVKSTLYECPWSALLSPVDCNEIVGDFSMALSLKHTRVPERKSWRWLLLSPLLALLAGRRSDNSVSGTPLARGAPAIAGTPVLAVAPLAALPPLVGL